MSKTGLYEGEKAAKETILRLLFTGALKTLAAIVTGMTVVLADAISTFADTLGLFASYIGLHLSRKGTGKNFKYGYYKFETFAALLVSIGIVYLGYVIVLQSIETFRHPSVGTNRPFAITITVFSIFQAWAIEKKLRKAAKKSNSLSLEANAKDKRMDLIAGVAIIISIIANYKNIPYVEGTISMIIAILILKEGLFTAKDSLFFLLDYWNDPVLASKIRRAIRKDKSLIKGIKKMRLRRAGTFIFGEAYIEINPFAGLDDLRESLDIIEKRIKDLNPYIKEFSIYTDIPEVDEIRVAVPIKENRGLDSPIASTPRSTYGYLFATVKNKRITKHKVHKLSDRERKTMALADLLIKEEVNILIDNNLHSLLYYNLRHNHQVLIYPAFSDVKNAQKAIQLLLIDT